MLAKDFVASFSDQRLPSLNGKNRNRKSLPEDPQLGECCQALDLYVGGLLSAKILLRK